MLRLLLYALQNGLSQRRRVTETATDTQRAPVTMTANRPFRRKSRRSAMPLPSSRLLEVGLGGSLRPWWIQGARWTLALLEDLVRYGMTKTLLSRAMLDGSLSLAPPQHVS